MKKVVLLLAIVFAAVTTNAQFKKTDKIVEGTISYTKTTGTDAVYSINPVIGYYLTDHVAVGVTGQFAKASTKTTGLGAFARCSFLTVGKSVLVNSQLSLTNTTVDNSGTKTTTFNSGLGLGAQYFVTKKLALAVQCADLITYTAVGSESVLTLGFTGINNPFSATKFGLTYKF